MTYDVIVYSFIFFVYLGLDKIEYLQHHSSEDLYKKAYEIIDQYFNDAESIEVENIAPQIQNNQFEFSQNPTQPDGGFSFWFLGAELSGSRA